MSYHKNFTVFFKFYLMIYYDNSDRCKIKQANCIKYLGVLVEKVTWNKHIEHIETKVSAASGAINKLPYALCKCSIYLNKM